MVLSQMYGPPFRCSNMKFSISYKTVNDSDVARNWHEWGADLRENNVGGTTQNQQKDAENNACIYLGPYDAICETMSTTAF